MQISVLVTDPILEGSAPIKYVSCLCEKGFVSVMASHSPTWEYGQMRRCDWRELRVQHPCLAAIEFRHGYWLLTRKADDSGWDAVKER
jgi:hypothetical protein